jgi:hypothetical protein
MTIRYTHLITKYCEYNTMRKWYACSIPSHWILIVRMLSYHSRYDQFVEE